MLRRKTYRGGVPGPGSQHDDLAGNHRDKGHQLHEVASAMRGDGEPVIPGAGDSPADAQGVTAWQWNGTQLGTPSGPGVLHRLRKQAAEDCTRPYVRTSNSLAAREASTENIRFQEGKTSECLPWGGRARSPIIGLGASSWTFKHTRLIHSDEYAKDLRGLS